MFNGHLANTGKKVVKKKTVGESESSLAKEPVDGVTDPKKELKVLAIHDPIRQSGLLREALRSDKVRIGCFIGAGCPLGIFDSEGTKSIKHLPDVAGLTKIIREVLEHDAKKSSLDNPFITMWDRLFAACELDLDSKPNVEHVLSEIRLLAGRRGKEKIEGIDKSELVELDSEICSIVADQVGKPLPSYRCSYHRFAQWVGNLDRTAPIELFTPNYDLLIEEAFEQQRIPHFDGFVGSREPFFDLASIEQDAIPSRWTRLWKLHGSINWQLGSNGSVFRTSGIASKGKAMIYPSHLKYDQSRRMPYLAMLDRLKSFFRGSDQSVNNAPPVLVISGYSFCDDHLNEVLLDGLRGNRGAQCFALIYSSLKDASAVVTLAESQPNLSVLAWDRAVVGTRKGLYRTPASSSEHTSPWIEIRSDEPKTSESSHLQMNCRLGDFHYFALFLEELCGGVSDAPE